MRLFFASVMLAGLVWAGANPGLMQVHTVYILPMGNGMDQHLASRLSQNGTLQVVADPQLADAILTDRIGEAFEKKLDELYPKPKDESDDEADDEEKVSNTKDQGPLRPNSFGHSKGTFFVVERKSRNVLWSVYMRPKNTSADEINRTAGRIVDRLNRDLKPQPAGK